jgi:hypothetical protein
MRHEPAFTKAQFLAWKEEECWTGEQAEDAAYDLYHAYLRWTERNGLYPAPLGIWSHWLQSRHRKIWKTAPNANGDVRKIWYVGVRLKPPVI